MSANSYRGESLLNNCCEGVLRCRYVLPAAYPNRFANRLMLLLLVDSVLERKAEVAARSLIVRVALRRLWEVLKSENFASLKNKA